jgi:hypothetical protein
MKRNLHLLAGLLVAVAATVALAVATPAKAEVVLGTYSHSDPSVTCRTDYNRYGQVSGRTISVDAPLMVSPRSTQQVSYQLFLYRWDPSSASWVYDFSLNPVGGMTGSYDLPTVPGFAINNPGHYYRIAIKYRWYWNGVVEASQFNYAGVHTQFFTQDFGNGVTSIWYGNTGDWCYMA